MISAWDREGRQIWAGLRMLSLADGVHFDHEKGSARGRMKSAGLREGCSVFGPMLSPLAGVIFTIADLGGASLLCRNLKTQDVHLGTTY